MTHPPKQYTQSRLTKIFASLSGQSFESLKTTIWFNPTNELSLRLTLSGYNFVVSSIRLHPYEHRLPTSLTNRHLLQLERYFPSMFYLLATSNRPALVVFDENEASMLALYGNDLAGYLSNLELVAKN